MRRGAPDIGDQRCHRGIDVVGGDRDQADLGGGRGVERLAGQVITGRGARGHLGQQRQRDDRRRHSDPRLGEREGAAWSRHGDVACSDQPHAAGADMAVDSDDHRQWRLDDGAQQRGHLPRPLGGCLGGVRAHLSGPLGEVGARAKRVPGVAEHHGPHRRIIRRVAQALMQLADQRSGQRIAVVR